MNMDDANMPEAFFGEPAPNPEFQTIDQGAGGMMFDDFDTVPQFLVDTQPQVDDKGEPKEPAKKRQKRLKTYGIVDSTTQLSMEDLKENQDTYLERMREKKLQKEKAKLNLKSEKELTDLLNVPRSLNGT